MNTGVTGDRSSQGGARSEKLTAAMFEAAKRAQMVPVLGRPTPLTNGPGRTAPGRKEQDTLLAASIKALPYEMPVARPWRLNVLAASEVPARPSARQCDGT